MVVKRVAPVTLKDLAAMTAGASTLYFGIGTAEEDDLLSFTFANLGADESLVAIDNGAGCLEEIETPERTPAIAAWCSKGALIDYAYDLRGIVELMDDARRFAS